MGSKKSMNIPGKTDGSSGIRKGRFKEGMDPLFAEFNASISFDRRLFREDVHGSVAHVRMLGAQGIIPWMKRNALKRGSMKSLMILRMAGSNFRKIWKTFI